MIIADTGFWLAFLDRKDQFHQVACKSMLSLEEGLITTLPVITETCYFLQARVGQAQSVAFLQRLLNGAFSMFPLDDRHMPRMVGLLSQYTDLPMDLADASSVVLAEHLGHGRILSTDLRDFHTYRWKNHHPFTNLLEAWIV